MKPLLKLVCHHLYRNHCLSSPICTSHLWAGQGNTGKSKGHSCLLTSCIICFCGFGSFMSSLGLFFSKKVFCVNMWPFLGQSDQKGVTKTEDESWVAFLTLFKIHACFSDLVPSQHLTSRNQCFHWGSGVFSNVCIWQEKANHVTSPHCILYPFLQPTLTGSSSELYCLRKSSGNPLWRLELSFVFWEIKSCYSNPLMKIGVWAEEGKWLNLKLCRIRFFWLLLLAGKTLAIFLFSAFSADHSS